MPTDKPFYSAAKIQAGFNRIAARIAGLSRGQFVLLAVVLLAAAGIAQGLWDQPTRHRVHITKKNTATPARKSDDASRGNGSVSAEIKIDEDGVRIQRKSASPETPSLPAQEANQGTGAAPATGTAPNGQDTQAPLQEPGPEVTKEVRIGNGLVVIRKHEPAASGTTGDSSGEKGTSEVQVQVPDIRISGADITDAEDVTVQARQPPLVTIALLIVLALFVMRIFSRAQQKTDAAVAVAERETLERQVMEAKLQLLQAQVEPHFLFNTLAAVEHLIETAPTRAAQMQKHLIEYLRAALPRMRQQSATLGQEVELCVNYLKIMQMRMEERLRFDVAVPAGLSSATFPPMMIQSLVENSIRHGLEPKPEGGAVNLRAEVRDGKLCVTVEDTGMGFSAAAPTGIGLANIRERLQQLFGAAAALTIEPNQPCGTRATISVTYAVN